MSVLVLLAMLPLLSLLLVLPYSLLLLRRHVLPGLPVLLALPALMLGLDLLALGLTGIGTRIDPRFPVPGIGILGIGTVWAFVARATTKNRTRRGQRRRGTRYGCRYARYSTSSGWN